jgi:hypothetical protein
MNLYTLDDQVLIYRLQSDNVSSGHSGLRTIWAMRKWYQMGYRELISCGPSEDIKFWAIDKSQHLCDRKIVPHGQSGYRNNCAVGKP